MSAGLATVGGRARASPLLAVLAVLAGLALLLSQSSASTGYTGLQNTYGENIVIASSMRVGGMVSGDHQLRETPPALALAEPPLRAVESSLSGSAELSPRGGQVHVLDANTGSMPALVGGFSDTVLLRDYMGRSVGIARITVLFYFMGSLGSGSTGLWLVLFSHYMDSLADGVDYSCYLPVASYGLSRVELDAGFYSDQYIAYSWLRQSTSSGIHARLESFYDPSNTSMPYAVSWEWGQSATLLPVMRGGEVIGGALISAVAHVETEYGEAGGAYLKVTVRSSLVCTEAFMDFYYAYTVTVTRTYWFYLTDTTYVRLG